MPTFPVSVNAAFDDFGELVTAINDWMDRDDLDGVAPQLIALAEDEMRLRLEPLFIEPSIGLVTDEAGAAALPADLKRVERVLYNGQPVKQVSITAVGDIPEGGNCPQAFTLEKGQLRLWPVGAYSVTVLYTKLLPRITSTNPTNELLDLFPSVYFFGAMTFAEGYVADDSGRKIEFRSLFDHMLNLVADHYRKQRYGGALVPNTVNVP